MFRRVPQPPIRPGSRSSEARGFWPGLGVGVLGLALLGAGAMNRTSIETTDGAEARETELIRAFAYGGLVHKEAAPPAPPMPTGDPTLDAAAMDRWQRQTAEANSTARKIRVDTGAKAACPT